MRTEKPEILIVDDIEINRALLGEIFQNSCQVVEAAGGRQALEALRKNAVRFSVVLLDLVMPEVDGFQVMAAMKELGLIGKLPVVMITAETSDWIMRKGYDLGAAEIINKPFSPSIVRRRIHNVMEQYAYRNKLENLVSEQTDELREQARKLRENSAQMIDTLSTIIEFKNMESSQHIYNIRTITKLLLTELCMRHGDYGLTPQEIENISEAAAMHDIGKIAIPDEILNKPGKLTKEEYEIMKTHCQKGCEILERLSKVQNLAYFDYCYEICRHHHERFDGKGYPDGLVGNETPIWAQAVSLADVYDALTSKRVYKEAYSGDKAAKMIMAGECGAFNPVLMDTLTALLPVLKSGKGTEDVQVGRQELSPAPVPLPGRNEESRLIGALELERDKYLTIAGMSEEALLEYNGELDILYLSPKLMALTGLNHEIKRFQMFIGKSKAVNGEDLDKVFAGMDGLTPKNRTCSFEIQLNLDRAGFAWYRLELYGVFGDQAAGPCRHYIGKLQNIETEIQRDLRKFMQARIDLLTGLLNRDSMMGKISAAIQKQPEQAAAVCLVDLDQFQAINDAFGRNLGDNVLKRVANHLRDGLDQDCLVGRVGGDEYMLFFPQAENDQALEARLRQLQHKLSDHFINIGLTASVGVALYPKDGKDVDGLFQRADKALFYAHRMGKGGCCIYHAGCEDIPFRTMLSEVEDDDGYIEQLGKALK